VKRTIASLLITAVISAGCLAESGPSDEPPGPSVAPSGTPPSSEPSIPASAPPASSAPTDPLAPTPAPFPEASPADGVPAALAQIAWAGSQLEDRADGTQVWHVFGGLINAPPTIRVNVSDPRGYPWLHVAADVVAIVSDADGSAHIDLRHATDGALLGSVDVAAGTSTGAVAIDPGRRLVYAAVARPAGGVDIRRVAFDGSSSVGLVTLDKRFTPDGIASERFGLTLDPAGVLLVEACGSADGCRLWEIPPDAAKAAKPRTLPGHPPIVCSIVGATSDWLVVSDDDACWADTSEAALPYRAIRRSDGTSHLITDDHVGAERVIPFGGRTYLVAADPAFAGATVSIVTYDVESGRKAVQLRGLLASPEEQTVAVSDVVLPGAWVLLEPWFVDAPSLPQIPARLLDLSTGTLIELPLGTFGWR
jgi:hypothetical protein